MSDHPTDFTGSVADAITAGIRERLPDAVVEVAGSGGHYRIIVTSAWFGGRSLLEQQRQVLASIKHLINGERAPVHAVDSLETRTP